MKPKPRDPVSLVFILVSVTIFFGSGLFHLGKFETTDEHFWKYERIPQYWQAIAERNPKKTHINDKPGVTVALLSGIGLPFSPDPTAHRDREETPKGSGLVSYHTEMTEPMNVALRLPILLFGTLMLPLLFFLVDRLTGNRNTARFSTLFTACSPVLIGMSQVMNPDAVLWSTMPAALIAFWAAIRRNDRRLVAIAGILFGIALLSKYTASLLFPLFLAIPFLEAANGEDPDPAFFRRSALALFGAFGIGTALFLLFMPSAILRPLQLLYGTVLSPATEPLFPVFAGAVAFFLIDILLFRSRLSTLAAKAVDRTLPVLARIVGIVMTTVVLLALGNALFGTPLYPLENVKEASMVEEELVFPMLEGYPPPIRHALALSIQSLGLVFSLHPLVLLGLLAAWILLFLRPRDESSRETFLFSSVMLLFLAGGIAADVFTNTRYLIVLFPLAAILAGDAIGRAFRLSLSKVGLYPSSSVPALATLFAVALFPILSIRDIAPHYLNYQNALLPREYVVVDAWGYGLYEAAMFLNSLPDHENLTVWSDRDGICEFFDGKRYSDRRFGADDPLPDYLVVTRRGMLRLRAWFESRGPEIPGSDALYSEESLANPAWVLHIGRRPDNFVKILKVSE